MIIMIKYGHTVVAKMTTFCWKTGNRYGKRLANVQLRKRMDRKFGWWRYYQGVHHEGVMMRELQLFAPIVLSSRIPLIGRRYRGDDYHIWRMTGCLAAEYFSYTISWMRRKFEHLPSHCVIKTGQSFMAACYFLGCFIGILPPTTAVTGSVQLRLTVDLWRMK